VPPLLAGRGTDCTRRGVPKDILREGSLPEGPRPRSRPRGIIERGLGERSFLRE
jgi:hypothetical protein